MRYKPSESITLLLLVFSIFRALAEAKTVQYQYDKGSPWRKLVLSANPNSPYEASQALLYPQYFRREETNEGVLSSRLPTEMLLVEGTATQPFSILTKTVRHELYQQQRKVQTPHDVKMDFHFYFSWCVHAKIADACKRAAELIENPDDFSSKHAHTFRPHRKISTLDGSPEHAKIARSLLLMRYDSLKQKSTGRSDKNSEEIKQNQDRFDLK